jgi:hypothetical protein
VNAAAAQPRRSLRLILALAAALLLIAVVAVYASRKIIAREALVDWLQSKGIAADATVEAIGPTDFVGTLRIGDPTRPDFAAERVEVGYAIKGLGVEVRTVTLRRPLLRGAVVNGQLKLGSLDPLIAEFMARPPRPDARQPRIEIVGGRVLLATDFGPLDARADALVDGGQLKRLSAVSRPMSIKGRGFSANLGEGRLTLDSQSDKVKVVFQAPVAQAQAGGARVEQASVAVNGVLPYPDLQKKRGDGAVVLNLNLAGARAMAAGQTLRDIRIDAAFVGQAKGWIPDLAVAGRAVANLTAGGAQAGGAQVSGLKIAATATDVDWSRAGGDHISAALTLAGGFDALRRDALSLKGVALAFKGSASADGGAVGLRLAGSANGRGAWTGLGRVTPEDSAEIAALKRGLADFRIAAPGVVLALDGRGPSAGLVQPLRLLTAEGGQASLTNPRPGAFALTMSGGGLPKVEAQVAGLKIGPQATTATADLKAALSIGPLQQTTIDAAGTLRVAGGGLAFTGSRCASVTVARLELGENDVEALSGRLCPAPGQPLASVGAGGWRLAGQAQGVAARWPMMQARIAEGAGPVSFGMAGGKLGAQVRIERAEVHDAAPQLRFNPLSLTATAGLAGDLWTADLAASAPGGAPLVKAELSHDGVARAGGVTLTTGPLTFVDGGLQPAALSPLAAVLGSPVTGQVEFAGRFDWTATTVTSLGALSLKGVDFQSPIGRVHGLTGQIGFSSLAPPIAAAGQALSVDQVDALVPITNVKATFALGEQSLLISAGEAAVGGGKVLVESLELPLVADKPMTGVVRLSGVQLHDAVEASALGDKVDLMAKVDGRVPFQIIGGKVRVSEGELKAVEPGRLSIQREALTTDAAAQAAAGAAPPNLVADFAYQAMENLAFDQLDAALNSADGGRLAIRFHILGRHDPPQKQQIRLSLMDLIQKRFLNKPLPLPSGVKVDLTLDTSLNLDDLLQDYGDYQRLRNSPPVQPDPATVPSPSLEKKP